MVPIERECPQNEGEMEIDLEDTAATKPPRKQRKFDH